MNKFDVIIIGSGPAGVSAAFPLLERGLKVLMVDGGMKSKITLPKNKYLEERRNDPSLNDWIIGNDFYALNHLDAASPKLRTPNLAYVFNEFEEKNHIVKNNFDVIGSLATGGLSNAWGCGVAKYSPQEFPDIPFSYQDLNLSYERIARRIGLSGGSDDALSEYFGLDSLQNKPIELDVHHQYLLDNYNKHSKLSKSDYFRLGRSRLAVSSIDINGRLGCNHLGNCMWGCSRKSLYNASFELQDLFKFPNFSMECGFIVSKLTKKGVLWQVHGDFEKEIFARKIILAAGTIATSRIALNSLGLYDFKLPLLHSPTATFLLWLPRFLGGARSDHFALGQLAFVISLPDGINAYGANLSTNGILTSEFIRKAPLNKRNALPLLTNILSSCVLGNLFLPSSLSKGYVLLKSNNDLIVEGSFDERLGSIMQKLKKIIRNSNLKLGAFLIPGSFQIGRPGADIHYSGTIPMKKNPSIGECDKNGEVNRLKGVYITDGACLPYLSEKPHTLTIMANADRIGRYISTNFKI